MQGPLGLVDHLCLLSRRRAHRSIRHYLGCHRPECHYITYDIH
ncbi:GSCOCG00002112001-RA-CDS [Cotesia congregata]|nr:GSCOCG00002112001-RA-CDS [Cotesia congregata]